MKKLTRWLGMIATGILFMNAVAPIVTLADQPVSVKEPLTASYLNQKINNVNKDTIQDTDPKITLTSNQTGTYIIPMSKTLFITNQKNQPLKEVQVTDKQSQKAYQKEIDAYHKKDSDDQSQKDLLANDYYQISLKAHQKLSLNLIGDSNATLNAILLDKNNSPEMFQTILKYQPKKNSLTNDQSKLFSQLQDNQTSKQLSKLPLLTIQWSKVEKENQKFSNAVQGTKSALNKAGTATKKVGTTKSAGATKTTKASSTKVKKPIAKYQSKSQKRVQKTAQKVIQSQNKEQSASKKIDKKAMNIKQTAKNQKIKAKAKNKDSRKIAKTKKSLKKVYPDNTSITDPMATVNSALAASNSSKAKTAASNTTQSVSAAEPSANISMLSATLPDVASSSIAGQQIDTSSTAVDGQQTVTQDVYVDSNGVASLPTTANPANVRITWSLKKGGNVDNDTVKDGQEVIYQFQVTANLISGTTQIPIKGLQLNFNPSLAESTSGISGSFNGVNYQTYSINPHDLIVSSSSTLNMFNSGFGGSGYGDSDTLDLTGTGQSETVAMWTTPMDLPTGFNLPISFQLSDQSAPHTYLASMDSINSLTIQANNAYSLQGSSSINSGATYDGNYSYNYKSLAVYYNLVNTDATDGSNGYDGEYFDPESLSYDASIEGEHDTSGINANTASLTDNDSQYQPVPKPMGFSLDGTSIALRYIDPNAYRPNGPANPNATTGSSAVDVSTIKNVSIKSIWGQSLTVSPSYDNFSVFWSNPLTSGDIIANFEPTGDRIGVDGDTIDKNSSSSAALGGAANYMPGYFRPTIGLFDKGGADSGYNEISDFEVMMNWNPDAFEMSSFGNYYLIGISGEDASSYDYGDSFEYGVLKSSVTTSDSQVHSLSDDDYDWYGVNSIPASATVSAVRYCASKALVNCSHAYLSVPLDFIGNSDSTGSHLANGQTRLVAAKVIDNGKDLLSNDPITQPASITSSSSTDQSPSAYNTNWMAGLEQPFEIEPGSSSFTENLAQSDFSSDENNQTIITNARVGDVVATNRFYRVTGQMTDYSKLSDSQILNMVSTYLPQIYNEDYAFEDNHQVTFYLNGEPVKISNCSLDISDSATEQAVLDAFRSGEVNAAGGFWITSNPVVVNTKDVTTGTGGTVICANVLPNVANATTMFDTEKDSFLNFISNNGIGINESIDQHFGNLNSGYTVKVVPYSEGSTSDTNLRGIITLPYNGDQAGSSFSGTDTLQSIKTINDNSQTIDYWYSTDTNEGRNPTTAISSDTAGNWQKLTDLNSIPSDAKSIAYQIEGTASNEDYEFDLTFQTNANQDGDIYQNTANINSDSAYQSATNAPTVGYLVYDESHAEINKTDGSTGNALPGATFKLADSQANATAGNYLVEYNDFIFNKDDAAKIWNIVKYDTNDDDKIDSSDYQNWLNDLTEVTFTTDSNGKASLTVPAGKDYYAVEVQAPDGGYALANPTELTLSSDSSNITPTNIKDYNNGTLTIDKIAQDTGNKLTGAEFKIYDSDGNEVTQDFNGNALNLTTTGSSGNYQQISVNLKPGTYTVVETKAPSGYELFKQAKTVTVTDGKTANVNFSDAVETAFPMAGGSLWKTIALIVLVVISSIMGYYFKKRSGDKHLEN